MPVDEEKDGPEKDEGEEDQSEEGFAVEPEYRKVSDSDYRRRDSDSK